jgi:inner membrane protein
MIGETPVAAAAPAQRRPLRESVLFKLCVIGLLMVALLIPLMMVSGLISERQMRHDQTAAEVANSWGLEQTLSGPVLRVPYVVRTKDDKGKEVIVAQLDAMFLPEDLAVDGRIIPERRSRGIFEVAVYRAHLSWKGSFRRPVFSDWGVAERDILWHEAELIFGVPDMRGLRRGVQMTWAGQRLDLAPGGAAEGMWTRGLRTPVPGLGGGAANRSFPFAFDLVLDGSRSLKFLPFGRQTTVKLSSPWPDPSFVGAYLPESRRVGESGFEAAWSVPYFGRSYPQQWRAADAEKVAPQDALNASAFGVDLFLPVDAYQKTERSLKYSMLFLLLTFLTFFLYEVFNPFSLHPLQYLLVGSALVLFYLLLLSISEHAPFWIGYVVASAATVGLIGGYAAAILRGRLRALGTAAALAFLYGYLYVLLQAEDYALLLGSVGLFAILALVMFVTRRIDWYAPRPGGGKAVPAG